MIDLGTHVAEVIPHAILNMPANPVPRRPETIAMYGQIGRKKGHDLAIRAIQSRPAGTFPVLEIWGAPGAGQEAYAVRMKDMVRADFRERILFRGYMPDDGKARSFSRMRLALFPYRWISQSGALAEAVAHGVPFLASDIPFFRDFQEGLGCGDLFRSDDAESLAGELERILSAPDRWSDDDFRHLRAASGHGRLHGAPVAPLGRRPPCSRAGRLGFPAMSDDLVWSTDPSFQGKLPQKGAMGSSRSRFGAPGCAGPVRKHLPKGPCVSLETSGRNGKGVTLVTGLPLSGKDLEDLGKVLRQACGSGGTVKDGTGGDPRRPPREGAGALSRKGISARRI
jgi:hypothetical protein